MIVLCFQYTPSYRNKRESKPLEVELEQHRPSKNLHVSAAINKRSTSRL